MSLIIRDCTFANLDELIELENECFLSPYNTDMLSKMLQNPLSIVLRAVFNGQLAGYIALEKACNEAELIKIAVKNEFRRNGIAVALLNSAELILVKNKIEKLFLEVDETNEPALSLYKNFGFSIISIRKKYYGDRAALIMLKNI